MEGEIIRRMDTGRGLREAAAAAQEEWFHLNQDGSIREVLLPGHTARFFLQEGEQLIRVRRHALLSGVIGCGRMQDRNGQNWGAWFRFSCRLLSARRLAAECGKQIEQAPARFQENIRKGMRRAFEETVCGREELLSPQEMETAYARKVRAFFEKEAEAWGMEVIDWTEGSLRPQGGV